jgi:hypothetical protein
MGISLTAILTFTETIWQYTWFTPANYLVQFDNVFHFYRRFCDAEYVQCQSRILQQGFSFNTTQTNLCVHMTCQLLVSRTHQSLCQTSYNRHKLLSHSCFAVCVEQVHEDIPKAAVRHPCAAELTYAPHSVLMTFICSSCLLFLALYTIIFIGRKSLL